jgi:hypothetical protein
MSPLQHRHREQNQHVISHTFEMAPRMHTTAAAAAALAALLALLLCPADAAPNATLSDLQLPEGFSVRLYYQDAITGIRSLALSGAPRPAGGPVIVYGVTRGADQVGRQPAAVHSKRPLGHAVPGCPTPGGGVCTACAGGGAGRLKCQRRGRQPDRAGGGGERPWRRSVA